MLDSMNMMMLIMVVLVIMIIANMELDRTPLFVDNTNIALWEMRDYLLAADRYGYEVEVVDPRQ